jgi:hypothetical protein
MTSATNGKQPCSDKSQCDYNDFRRPRYFHGKLLDDKDFRAEQNYHSGKRRLLNRSLHGSGVVCGLEVTSQKGAQWFKISPGVAFDHEGNEIWVETEERVDISNLLPPADAKTKQPDCPPATSTTPNTYYIAICYKEAGTDPVPVYLPGASCDNTTCEYSSDKEGYCIKLLTTCDQPKAKDGLFKNLCAANCPPDQQPDFDCDHCADLTDPTAKARCCVLENFCETSPTCPDMGPCGQSRCVILGQIVLDAKGTVQNLCVNECREYVISGRFVKYLISSTLSGIGDILKVGNQKLIDGADIARNPIEALCWLLRYLVVEKGSINAASCQDIFGGATAPQVSPTDFKNLSDQVGQLKTETASVLSLTTRVDAVETKVSVAQTLMSHVEQLDNKVTALDEKVTSLQPKPPQA